MRYYIIAGEASGDLYGSALIEELHRLDSKAIIRGIGGDQMKRTDMGLFLHNSVMSVMGYKDVILNLDKLNKIFRSTKKDILSYKPDAIIYIDYPGFNLRMAKWAKNQNIKNIYFICPKIWAWKKSRYKTIKSAVDKMICVLPFEVKYLKALDIESSYFGHPLAQKTKTFQDQNKSVKLDQIAVLPGSRKQELRKLLPTINQLITHDINNKYIVSKVKHIPIEFYMQYLDKNERVKLVEGNTYELLSTSKKAIVTSGTATLECALLETPQIVIYKADRLSYMIAKKLVKLDYISLPNLILNKEVVAELIQEKCNLKNILDELKKLDDSANMARLKDDYSALQMLLYNQNSMANIGKEIKEFTAY